MKASYKYQAEDVDELAFDVGEIVNVVEYDDPEDQVEHRLLFSKYTLFVAVDVVCTRQSYWHFYLSVILKYSSSFYVIEAV